MSRRPQAVTYADVLRRPGAARALAAATPSRLSSGTVVLSLLLAVQRATGSSAVALLGGTGAASAGPHLLLAVVAYPRPPSRRTQRSRSEKATRCSCHVLAHSRPDRPEHRRRASVARRSRTAGAAAPRDRPLPRGASAEPWSGRHGL